MAWRLSGNAGSWALAEGEHIIGREPSCSLCIPDVRLSRKHAKVVVSGDQAVLHDLGSANGVLRNGDRIQKPTALRPGDIIVCGPVRLTVARDGETPPAQQPTTSTLAGRTPASGTEARKHTEPMRSTAEMRASEIGRAFRGEDEPPPRLNPAIAAALPSGAAAAASEGSGFPIGTPMSTTSELPNGAVRGSSSMHPSEVAPLGSTSALSPNRFHPPATPGEPHRTTNILPSDAPSHDTAALLAHSPSELHAPRLKRAIAGIGDPLLSLFAGLLVGGSIALTGGIAALRWATAGVAEGHLQVPGTIPASAGELAAVLLHPTTWLHLDQLASQLHHLPSAGPFALLFLTWAAGAVLLELALLAGLVAMTVAKGGPWLHRRLGLALVIKRNGHHPGWLRALWRWLLLAVTFPLAIVTLALDTRGLHDRLSGCEVRRRVVPHRHTAA